MITVLSFLVSVGIFLFTFWLKNFSEETNIWLIWPSMKTPMLKDLITGNFGYDLLFYFLVNEKRF